MNSIKRLPDAELEVMLSIWQTGDPVTSLNVIEKLKSKRPWALPTLMTVLGRLVEKGFLKCEKSGRNNFYYVLVSESEYKELECNSFLERLYDNSFKNFVTALYNGKRIDAEDLADLKEFLDELEKGN